MPGFEYFADIDTKPKLEAVLAEYDFAKLLGYEPMSRTKMCLELKELCEKLSRETPGYLKDFIADPNAWTEVALRLDVGQAAPFLDRVNAAYGTKYENYAEFKAAAFGAGALLDDIEEVTASEEDDFVADALARFGKVK